MALGHLHMVILVPASSLPPCVTNLISASVGLICLDKKEHTFTLKCRSSFTAVALLQEIRIELLAYSCVGT